MKKIIWLLVIGIAFVSCKKEYLRPRSGIFRGTFEKTGLNGGGFETGDCSLALNDINESFSLSADTTSEVPYNCGGTYLVVDATKIKFNSNTLVDEFEDPYIFLDSVFTYTFNDINFDLTRKIDTIVYEYKFIRY